MFFRFRSFVCSFRVIALVSFALVCCAAADIFGELHKIKSSAVIKNSTIAKMVYLSQYSSHNTRQVTFWFAEIAKFDFYFDYFLFLIRRHHNVAVVANKTTFARRNPTTKKITQFQSLHHLPIYHSSQPHLNVSGTTLHHLRNRSSIQKRSSNDWLSKNISMVLEQLLMHYENSYLPTHGQGNCRYWIESLNCSFQWITESIVRSFCRCADCRQNKHFDSKHGSRLWTGYGELMRPLADRWRRRPRSRFNFNCSTALFAFLSTSLLLFFEGLFDGLLFSSILERHSIEVSRTHEKPIA